MIESETWVTPKQAGELVNYSKKHITNLINSGKLSAKKNDAGHNLIDKAELFRRFPEAFKEPMQTKSTEKALLELENKHLQELLRIKQEEIENLRTQLEQYSHEKNKMLEAITSHARLLEHKTEKPAGKWRLFK